MQFIPPLTSESAERDRPYKDIINIELPGSNWDFDKSLGGVQGNNYSRVKKKKNPQQPQNQDISADGWGRNITSGFVGFDSTLRTKPCHFPPEPLIPRKSGFIGAHLNPYFSTPRSPSCWTQNQGFNPTNFIPQAFPQLLSHWRPCGKNQPGPGGGGTLGGSACGINTEKIKKDKVLLHVSHWKAWKRRQFLN